METVSKIRSSYSIINLNVDWIDHRLLIAETSLVKFVKSPRIYPFPLKSNYIIGTYYFNGALIPVISLVNYFDSKFGITQEIENILIVKTSDGFHIAFNDVIQSGFAPESDLDQNIDFINSYSTVFGSDQLIVQEYKIRGENSRGFLIDIDYLKREIVEKIRSVNTSTLTEVKEKSHLFATNSNLYSELDTVVSQTLDSSKLKSIDASDPLQLIFRVDEQFYSISTNSVLSILSSIPLINSTHTQFEYFVGVIKTMYGSANVFDLRTYFGYPSTGKSEYILLSEDDRNYVYIVDEIVSYFQVADYEIEDHVYPITGTSDSFYKGVYVISGNEESILVFALSSSQLANYLFSGNTNLLGIASQYEFQILEENQQLHTSQENQTLIAWIGDKVRVGFNLNQIELIDQFVVEINSDQLFSRFDHEKFGELPVFNLNLFYDIPFGINENMVILKKEDEHYAIYISGDVDIHPIPKSGNLDNLGFGSQVFHTEKHLIEDFAIFDNFVGFLLSVEEIFQYMKSNNETPVKYEHVEEEIEYMDYFVVGTSSTSYCIQIKDIEGLIKTNQINEGLYDLDKFIEGNLEPSHYPSPLFCIKLNHQSQYFSTNGTIDIVKFRKVEIESIRSSGKDPVVTLQNGGEAKIISFSEVK